MGKDRAESDIKLRYWSLKRGFSFKIERVARGSPQGPLELALLKMVNVLRILVNQVKDRIYSLYLRTSTRKILLYLLGLNVSLRFLLSYAPL